MGHLGNPIGFRLGFAKKWNFNFFIKNVYYPEFINNLINIRDYIYYYLTRKKILQSGVCFSHLLLFKYLKMYYIKIYIYHIDLEKQSYDYINILYQNYYDSYNKVNFKFVKNKTMQQLHIYHNARDLSNSDLFLFYFQCLTFYQAAPLTKSIIFLKKNKYFNRCEHKIIKEYSSFIIFKYLKFYFLTVIKKRWNYVKNLKAFFKWKKLLKRYRRKKYLVEQRKRKLKYSMLKKAKNFLIGNQYMIKNKIKGLSNNEKEYLNKCLNFKLRYKIKNRIKKFFVSYFYKKLYKKNKNLNIFAKNTVLRETFSDIQFNQKHWVNNKINFVNYLKKKKRIFKLNVLNLFLYLAKKVKFQKVKNSRSLKRKWLIISKYLKMFSSTNCLDIKGSGLISIKPFLFLLHMFIYLSKMASRKIGIGFNLKHALYHTIYFGIFFNCFFKALTLMVFFLKQGINLICKSIKKNNIYFYFFFLTNQNVTSQLITRYIALKLKKGFTLKRIMYPLKRELIRVSLKGRGKQKPYKRSNFRLLYAKKKKKIKLFFQRYTKYYFNFFLINFFNYLKSNDTLIYFNMFYDNHKKYKNKSKKCIIKRIALNKYKTRLAYYYDKNMIEIGAKAQNRFILKKKDKCTQLIKLNNLKNFNVNIIYPFLFNFDKKKSLYIMSFYKLDFIENAYFNSFKMLNSRPFSNTKPIKLVNSKNIYISSFFSKNYINFHIIQSLWLIYKKLNIRNLRQKYIPIYNSGIMGFKIVFKGRFSRKQRASKATLNIGKVPLNTLNKQIDYTFLPVTLKNSVVSIKLYIYKNSIFQGYKNIVKV